jgi:hypothetical protein
MRNFALIWLILLLLSCQPIPSARIGQWNPVLISNKQPCINVSGFYNLLSSEINGGLIKVDQPREHITTMLFGMSSFQNNDKANIENVIQGDLIGIQQQGCTSITLSLYKKNQLLLRRYLEVDSVNSTLRLKVVPANELLPIGLGNFRHLDGKNYTAGFRVSEDGALLFIIAPIYQNLSKSGYRGHPALMVARLPSF